MRLNKFIATSTTLSRRAADAAIAAGRVSVNGQTAAVGDQVKPTDVILLDGVKLTVRETTTTIMLHKPTGYVCSRDGQGSQTVYDLLPTELHHLKPVGRLDKDSSGLLLMTDDGDLAQELTHPKYAKTKAYEVTLDRPLQPLHQQLISDFGVNLEDGLSRFTISKQVTEPVIAVKTGTPSAARTDEIPDQVRNDREAGEQIIYEITMTEGRNRQIRRTFAALGYTVTTLHRTHFGPYHLSTLEEGDYKLQQAY